MTGLVRLALLVAVMPVVTGRTACGCACCANEGHRNVATVKLNSFKWQQLESPRFAD